MGKKKRPGRNRRRAAAEISASEANAVVSVIDALAEIVHQGYGRLVDVGQLRATVSGWQPHCSMNYEYVFVWKPSSGDTQRDRQAAEDCLHAGTDCQWVDLSFITDSQGRDIHIIEMGDAVTGGDDDFDSVIERMDEIWHWKSQPLTIVGPFASSDDAEAWMDENGAFKEAGG